MASVDVSPVSVESLAKPSSKTENEIDDYPCPIGIRVYVDEKTKVEEQTLFEHSIAVLTLALYTALPYILVTLLCLSFFPVILKLNVLLISTLFLPCPLFSESFLNCKFFQLWRQYFSFSYLMEEVRLPSCFQNKSVFSRDFQETRNTSLQNFPMAHFQ